jgi:MFS family permease
VILLAALDAAIVATVVPPIVSDLGGFSLFPWLFSVYLLAQAATVPIYSKLADLYGRKPVLLAGVTGAILPIAMTVVGDLYSVSERARIHGWLSGGVLLIGMTTFLPTYVQGVHQTTTLVAGFVLAATSLGWSLSSTFSSRLYLRIGFRDAAPIGMGLAVVAGLVLGMLPGSSPLWGADARQRRRRRGARQRRQLDARRLVPAGTGRYAREAP